MSSNFSHQFSIDEFIKLCSEHGLLEPDSIGSVLGFAKALGGVGAVPKFHKSLLDNEDELSEIFALHVPSNLRFDSFIVSEANFFAFEFARTIAIVKQTWNIYTPLYIQSSSGMGKTHLLFAVANASRNKSLYLNVSDLKIQFQHMVSVQSEHMLSSWITSHDLLLIDDLQSCRGDRPLQEFLCGVLTRMEAPDHALVLASDIQPWDLEWMTPSLLSRVTSGVITGLNMLNDAARREVLVRMFSRRGIEADDEAIAFIASRVNSSVRQLKAVGCSLIAKSITTGKPVTKEWAAGVLSWFETQATSIKRPDESENSILPSKSANHLQTSCSDVAADDSDKTHSDDGSEFEEPATDNYTGEEVPQIAETTPAHLEAVVPEEKTENGVVAEKYKDMLLKADTLSGQCKTLILALEERMKQIRNNGNTDAENQRIEAALSFLREDNLTAAMVCLRSVSNA